MARPGGAGGREPLPSPITAEVRRRHQQTASPRSVCPKYWLQGIRLAGVSLAFNYSSVIATLLVETTFSGSLFQWVCVYRGVRTNGACLESRSIAKAPPGEGCPRCGGYVYAAEQMLARGKVSLPIYLNHQTLNKFTKYAHKLQFTNTK